LLGGFFGVIQSAYHPKPLEKINHSLNTSDGDQYFRKSIGVGSRFKLVLLFGWGGIVVACIGGFIEGGGRRIIGRVTMLIGWLSIGIGLLIESKIILK